MHQLTQCAPASRCCRPPLPPHAHPAQPHPPPSRCRPLQLYIHVTALAFAEHTKQSGFSSVEVTLPPAVRRGAFVSEAVNDWGPAPLESLLDVERMTKFWAGRGIRLGQVGAGQAQACGG